VAVAVWALVILAATSIPGSHDSTALPHWADKVVHFVLYCVLGILAARALLTPPPGRVEAIGGAPGRKLIPAGWLALSLLAIFAGADELHQHWIRGRNPSSGDWIADVLGAGSGIAIGTYVRRSTRKSEPGPDRETNC
jgi:VanZ family protein